MLEFQDKRKIRQFLYSRLTILALLLLAVFSVNAAIGAYHKASEATEKKDLALSEQNTLKAKELELQANLSQLKTDRGLEEEIRRKYRVVKEGESMIIVVGDKETAPAPEKPGFRPLFERIWEIFQ